jgi:hypothetical protein
MEWMVVFVGVEARCVLDQHLPWDGMIFRGHSSDIDVCYMIWSPTGSDTPLVWQSTVSHGVWRIYPRVRRGMASVLESQPHDNCYWELCQRWFENATRISELHKYYKPPAQAQVFQARRAKAEFIPVEWHGRSCYDWSLNPWQAAKFRCQDTISRCKYFGPQRFQSLDAAASNVYGS